MKPPKNQRTARTHEPKLPTEAQHLAALKARLKFETRRNKS